MIDVCYASLFSQGVQHRVLYLDGHPSRYQPRPTGLNFGEQKGTGVFPLVIAVPSRLCRSILVPKFSLSAVSIFDVIWRHRFNNLQRAALLTSLVQYLVNYACGFNQSETGKI